MKKEFDIKPIPLVATYKDLGDLETYLEGFNKEEGFFINLGFSLCWNYFAWKISGNEFKVNIDQVDTK